MVILVICLVGLMTAYDYINLKSSIEHESSALQNQTEQSITAALRLTDKTNTIMDEQLNRQMLGGFDVLFAEYNRSGGNPAAMDLTKVKDTLGDGYDIYIIYESGVIVYTTYPSELGQDFRQVPYFYEYLTKVRMSQGFFPDRVVHELLGTGTYRKYAYEPTPDHQYVMEIGYSTPAFKATNQMIDNQNNIAEIVLANPYVDQFRIFDMMGHRVDDTSLPDNRTESFLRQVIASRQTLEINDPVNHDTIRYLFIDLKNPRYGSDLSRIVEITYDTNRIDEALNYLVFIHLLFGILALLIGCALAYAFSRRMNRPIAEIAHYADIIASGDFEHRIGTTKAREFMILEKSINKMVDSLKASAKTLKDEEIFHRDLINQMPVGIFLKELGTGRYVFWNRANEEIFELAATDVIGKSDEEIFPAAQAAQIKEEDTLALDSRLEIKCKKVTTRTHGERVLHMIIVPIYDSKKSVRYILGITEDVTDEVSSLKKDLIFSITRSDILDQLAIIMSYLERAQLKTTREDLQKFFDKTIGSVESIKNQIAYEGALQMPGFITPQWQSVTQAFNEAIRMLPEHSIDIRVDAGDIEIFADPLLPRIFFGLLSWSFRRGGQTITKIQMTAHRTGESLVLVYEDDRNGIPMAEKERIFEFGYSHENAVSLFLIRELLSFTGITITETGEKETGIRFEIVVPKGRFRPAK
ncbi:MAG: PAS domain-containing protein [Methanoregula sp.]